MMTEFSGVVPTLNQALDKQGYTHLTPVQEAVLAPELKDADLLVSAQTGSGKTVAFGLALAPTLLDDTDYFASTNAPLALIVAPTRELALQVKRELTWLYDAADAMLASCVGGMDMRDERRALARGAHIVVGTPGRLIDHIKRGSLDMSALRAIVLDEADEMLDLGFRDELEFILGAAPTTRRTLMFSATVPRTIATLAKNYQRDAVRLNTASEQKQHLDIEYRALTVAAQDRENAIINILRFFEAKNAIVFCATRATVNHMTSRFNNRGFSVVALSGELSQRDRSHALQSMRDGRARVCVATDVAARGIDLPDLELVIHADLPKNAESLLHRSGRTGRAGRKGVSTLIVPHNARKRTERLLSNAKIKAKWDKPPSAKDVRRRDDERLLSDEILIEPIKDSEQDLAQALLATHSAEQIAAAFVRAHRADRSAPEELLDMPPERAERSERAPRKAKRRDDFENGVWITLSVGSSHTAEPRWLLPMLCKAGGLKKQDIGAIKINKTDSLVELAPDCVDRFFEKIGPSRKLEKTITAERVGGAPEMPYDQKAPELAEKPRAPKKTKTKSTAAPHAGKAKNKPAYADKPRQKTKERGAETESGAAPTKREKRKTLGLPKDGAADGTGTKRPARSKSRKPKFTKGKPKPGGRAASRSGSQPPKRKKMKKKPG